MSLRGERLQGLVDGQLDRLDRVVAVIDPVLAREPCPGRAKLGDGSIGSVTVHTVRNYSRIAGFASGGGHTDGGEGNHGHGGSADGFDARVVAHQLAAARAGFGVLGALSDERLDEVPAAESFRFCDGQRTLEQVLTALLTHQDHQLDALEAAVQSPA